MRIIHSLLPVSLVAGFAFAQNLKMSPELQGIDPKTTIQVIVQFDKDPTDAHHQKVFTRGGSWRATLHSVKAGAYSVPASAVADLAKDSSVVHISLDHKISAKLDYNAAAVNANLVWPRGVDGSGVGVAVIDSGVTPVADLGGRQGGSRIVYAQDLIGGDGLDHYGHGEHIAGIIAGNGNTSECSTCTRTLKGIAPNATIIDLRVLDKNGEGTDSGIISAIDTAISLKKTYNIRVINLSLGRPIFESYKQDPLCQAVEAAWKAGIVVVVAAGNEGRDNTADNDGYGTITAPGNDPYVITVGGMKTMGTYDRSDDLIASYSSKGPTLIDNVVKPDIVAPGNKVVSILASSKVTLATEYPQNLVPVSYYNGTTSTAESTHYYMLSGTSMAAGVASGAVADLLQAQPLLTPDHVKARLMNSAYKVFPESSVAIDPVTGASYTSYYDVFTIGAGYLDLNAALQSKDAPWGMALSPTVTFDNRTDKAYLVFDPSSIWAFSAILGKYSPSGTSSSGATGLPWGTGVVRADRSLWGESAAWATSGAWASSGIWGSSLLTAERSLWGESAPSATATQQTEGPPLVIAGEQ